MQQNMSDCHNPTFPLPKNGLFRITVLYMLSVDVDKAFVSEYI